MVSVREKKRDARRRRSPRATPSSSPRPRWVFETHLETRLLQRHEPARAPLPGLVHLPVGALPNLLELLIRFVDAVAHRERRRLSRDSFYLRARVSHGVRAASIGARVDVRDDEACGRSCGRSSRCAGPLAGLRAFVFFCRESSRYLSPASFEATSSVYVRRTTREDKLLRGRHNLIKVVT